LNLLAGIVCAALIGLPWAGHAADTFLDAVLAEVNGRTLTASDVAVARALSLLGMRPSSEPILKADVDRMVDGLLVDQEAAQLAIGESEEELEAAWRAAAARTGGMPALLQWLDETALDPTWARGMIRRDVRYRRFLDLRFRTFVFVTDAEIAAALGPGSHGADARERAREALREAAVARELAAWLVEARRRATLRYADGRPGGTPLPFRMPPTVGR
jgi:hypothetical protein